KPSGDCPYLFNGFKSLTEAYDNPLHQRAAMCVDLLHNDDKVTIEDAFEVAMSPAVYGADQWQDRLRKAWSNASPETRQKKSLAAIAELILNWNRRAESDSTAAVAYQHWKAAFGDQVKQADRAGFPPPSTITDEMLLAKLDEASNQLTADFGRIDVPY